jgi:LysR family transcriptional regulator, transcriptional activator of the cysJI operon
MIQVCDDMTDDELTRRIRQLAAELDLALVRAQEPWFADRRLSRQELESLTWISREEGSATRAAVEAAFADLGIAPRRRLELPSWEAIKLAVRRGHGIAACSRFAVEEELRTGSLAAIPVRRWNVRKTMSVIRVRDAALTPSALQFLLLLRSRWGRVPSQGSPRKRVTAR